MTERAATEADAIQRALSAGIPAGRAEASKAYIKIDLQFLGTSVPQARSIVTQWRRERPGLDRAQLLAVVSDLWDRPVFECRMAAVLLLVDRVSLLEAADLDLIEQLLRRSGTWALVDSMAADVAGSLVARFPELVSTLDRWAQDPDFWIRRSAMLALLVPLRHGDPEPFQRFARFADQMLEEREFFIRKAIGWVLRETAKKQPDLVMEWLTPRAHLASGVTMREALKYLPPADRETLMATYRSSSRHPRPARTAQQAPD